jgi:hypothetical protein
MTAFYLRGLILDEISLVDVPANKSATVALFKRHEETMTEKTEKEAHEAEMNLKDTLIATHETALKALKEENTKLVKAFDDNGFDVDGETITKRVAVEMIEVGGEKVAKSAIPAPVLKALEEALAKADEAAIVKRAEEILPHLPVEKAKALLTGVKDLELLKSIDAAFAQTMEELGKSAPKEEMASAADALEAYVKAYQSDNPKMTYHAAYAAVAKTAEGKKLIAKTYNKEV